VTWLLKLPTNHKSPVFRLDYMQSAPVERHDEL